MYKALIVDDEVSVVEALEATIPWQQLGIDTVATATSGDEAIAEMHRQPADILITDIRMPGKTGLDLIQQIKQHWVKTRFILISGHAEFKYAQSAVKNGADDYLLKPVRDEDMIQAVRSSVAHIREEWLTISSHDQAMKTFKENLPLLQSLFLNDILQGRAYTEEIIEQKKHELHIPFEINEPTELVLVRLETEEARNHLQHMQFAIMKYAQEILETPFIVWPCTESHDYVILLIQQRNGYADHENALQNASSLLSSLIVQLQSSVMKHLNFPVSTVLSNWGVFPGDIPRMYQQSLNAIRQHSSSDQGIFIELREPPGLVPIPILRTLHEPPSILHFLEAGRWDAVSDKLERIFEELEQTGKGHNELLLEVFLHISHAYSFIAHKQGKLLSEVIGPDFEPFDSRISFYSVHQLREWSLRILNKINAEFSSEAKSSRRSIIEQVQKYIHEHLSEDITLQTLADHVRLHPVYVSRIFKLETEEKISDYILRLKMEKAQHLLFNGDLKIYQIAEKLGYFNTPYFIQVFKKYNGCTPQEYRENACIS